MKFKFCFCFSFWIFILVLLLCADNVQAKLYYWNHERLDSIKTFGLSDNVVNRCFELADTYVNNKVLIVTNKVHSFSGNKHNLEGIAPYFWEKKVNGKVQWIAYDGKINPAISKYDNNKIYELETRLRTLSIAYFLSGKSEYFNAYIKQINAWFISSKTKMYPNFDYAQLIPGKNNKKGEPGGLIEAYALNGILESYRLLNSCKHINKRIDKSMKQWFSALALWMTTSENGIAESKTHNNHSIVYYENLINISIFINNDYLLKQALDGLSYAINDQIDENGHQKNELIRAAAYDYSVYNLTHIIDACIIAKNAGYDIYSIHSKKIERAASFLLRYANENKKFPFGNVMSKDYRSIRVQCNRLLRLNSNLPFSRYNPLTSNYYFVQ